MTRRGFAIGSASALAALGGLRWLATQPEAGGLIRPIRRVLESNERITRSTFRPTRLAPEFGRGRAVIPRVNGLIGIDTTLDPRAWRLKVGGGGGGVNGVERSYTLAEIRGLPRVESTTELKCIEGWSAVVSWAGARLADLALRSGLATRSGRPLDPASRPGDVLNYLAIESVSGGYFVGIDAASALHPQTLLCYEMDGEPLPPEHGGPLRLVIPIKYGIKNIKQIGSIRFTDVRPADYWAGLGYDWYAGL